MKYMSVEGMNKSDFLPFTAKQIYNHPCNTAYGAGLCRMSINYMGFETLYEFNDLPDRPQIIEKRNLPYSIKVERVEGNKIFCRNSWGNHILYIRQDNNFYLETEL